MDCFHFRLDLACPWLVRLFFLGAQLILSHFITEKINSQQWEDPKVSVQLADKYRSLATAIST